ncbi:MAG: lysylphosphatidylglycerol synthase domain-containing protein, partial [Planctomycetota bacterium]|nr:lysylphosphatidylglycerol synthase domain-containing protein [Planctomycetota bacterium]
LKGLCGITGPVSLAALLLARLLDLFTVAFSMALVCALLASSPRFDHLSWLGPLALILAAVAAVLFILLRSSERLVLLAGRAAQLLSKRAPRLAAKLQQAASSVAEAIARAGSGGRLLRGLLLSLPLWLGVYLYFAVLARGVGMPSSVTFPESIFGASLAVLSNLLPINGFAGFGTQDAGWVLGFGALGLPRATALTTALGFHLVHLANVVLLGVLGHLAMGLRRGGD